MADAEKVIVARVKVLGNGFVRLPCDENGQVVCWRTEVPETKESFKFISEIMYEREQMNAKIDNFKKMTELEMAKTDYFTNANYRIRQEKAVNELTKPPVSDTCLHWFRNPEIIGTLTESLQKIFSIMARKPATEEKEE